MRRAFRAAAILAALAPAAPAPAATLTSYVVMGPGGAAEVRAITEAAHCPELVVDGKPRPMRPRAPAGEAALRKTVSDPSLSKPAAFPVTACEARLPEGARRARLDGQALPLPVAVVRRIVVIGDTGCRLKGADKAYQACNDPKAYPFARVAARAAAWKPDLVIHVGDYEYRENPCDASKADCAGSPWGYGWDAWRADFFDPAAPLLAAAPWVLVRGNHEDCARAGQGWMRFLDPAPLESARNCDDASRDTASDDSAPYAVPLGAGVQVIVADMSTAGTSATPADDPRHAQFAADQAAIARLAANGGYSFLALHKPILGFAADAKAGSPAVRPVMAGIQSVFAEADPQLSLPHVGTILAGHIHVWEQVSFSSDHPSQFIAGFSGTQEDIVPLPAALPEGATPFPAARPAAFSSWVAGFGYMTLERRAADRWDVKVWNLEGQVVNRCEIRGRKSKCERAQVP
jgi:hypothetical protein